MKLMKYTFRTPLFGSIECEELLPDTDGRIDLSPEQMCRMYEQGDELLRFLSDNVEDLTFCVPEELQSVILRAEFGDCAILGGKMWLNTYIWVEGDLTELGIQQIEDWIAGQMSDGWGEGLEQRSWTEKRVERPFVYFNEYTMEFQEDYELCEVSYYVNPWNSEEFYIYLDDCEEVQELTTYKVVATVDLPHHNREVIQIEDGLSLTLFLKESGQPDLAGIIKENCPVVPCNVYLVRDLNGNSGIELLPKWVVDRGSFCAHYDMSVEEEVRGQQMPVTKAILELLK
jgi:hypothetical protein